MSSIELKDVCLDYIVKTGSDSMKKAILNVTHLLTKKTLKNVKNSHYRALNNITFKLNKGDRLGILGKNGAGKSTLLRVLAKIYKPNMGSVDIQGNISALFDIKLGTNPEATGYENILNLAIMKGLTKKEALALIPHVEAFTELGEALKAPLRTFSSGMQMKLAFSVATAITPQILLLDEVIGVGDEQFIKKAELRMQNMIENSQILVLTTHSVETLRKFCNKSIVLSKGEMIFFGDLEEGVSCYRHSFIE